MSLLLYDTVYKDGVLDIDKQVCKELTQLAEIVLNKHYSYVNSYDREDLKSEAVLKAIMLLKEGDFDASKSSLKNFIYTGMRNAMQNYMYHNKNSKKEVLQDEFYEGCSDDLSTMIGSIPYSLVSNTISPFRRRNKISSSDICDYIRSMGFLVNGEVRDKSGMSNELKEKLVCLVLWKNQSEYCH